MKVKRVFILIAAGLFGSISIINLLSFILTSNITGTGVSSYDAGRVVGRIIGGAIISLLCIIAFIRVILRIKEEKFYKS